MRGEGVRGREDELAVVPPATLCIAVSVTALVLASGPVI